jgi:hypothetical protein
LSQNDGMHRNSIGVGSARLDGSKASHVERKRASSKEKLVRSHRLMTLGPGPGGYRTELEFLGIGFAGTIDDTCRRLLLQRCCHRDTITALSAAMTDVAMIPPMWLHVRSGTAQFSGLQVMAVHRRESRIRTAIFNAKQNMISALTCFVDC